MTSEVSWNPDLELFREEEDETWIKSADPEELKKEELIESCNGWFQDGERNYDDCFSAVLHTQAIK